jgi:hypothetical protein
MSFLPPDIDCVVYPADSDSLICLRVLVLLSCTVSALQKLVIFRPSTGQVRSQTG